jgi:hypothetical protein
MIAYNHAHSYERKMFSIASDSGTKRSVTINAPTTW